MNRPNAVHESQSRMKNGLGGPRGDLSPLKHNQHTSPSLHGCWRDLVGGQHKTIRSLVPQFIGITIRRVAGGIDVVHARPGGSVQRAAGLSDGV